MFKYFRLHLHASKFQPSVKNSVRVYVHFFADYLFGLCRCVVSKEQDVKALKATCS